MEILLGIIAIPLVLMALLGMASVFFKVLAFLLDVGGNIIGFFFKLIFSSAMLLLALFGFLVLYAGFSDRKPKVESTKTEVVQDSVKKASLK